MKKGHAEKGVTFVIMTNMGQTLLQKLSTWQKRQALKEGVEGYMVVSFSALKEIAAKKPQTEKELLAVKGIGPAKVEKYGSVILDMISGKEGQTMEGQSSLFSEAERVQEILEQNEEEIAKSEKRKTQSANQASSENIVDQSTGEVLDQEEKVFSVGDFLLQLNRILASYFSSVRVRGEVIGFKRNQNGHAYFELKDENSVMRCSVFKQAYDLSGVSLEDGMEIVVTGHPQHHERYGFSFIGESVELFGEGALKKAYLALKEKLEKEGFFSLEKKRALMEFPRTIGLITSQTGAAIGDFTTNIGSFGFDIRFVHSSVEGQKAVKELLGALEHMKKQPLDVLAVVRGGGSLESLQAFNNEHVVRALADFPVPTVVGVGHEQDETLATLVGDIGVSTPTAAARAIRHNWDGAAERLRIQKEELLRQFESNLEEKKDLVERSIALFDRGAERVRDYFENLAQRISVAAQHLENLVKSTKERVSFWEKTLVAHDPQKKLAQGYSITRNEEGKIVKSIKSAKKGEKLDVEVLDGTIGTKVDSVSHS